jgi:signal transduction histidine kinase/ActR/RegA family two-component response regulator
VSVPDSVPDRPAAPAAAAPAGQRLELLALAGEVFARSLDRRETLDAIARTVVPRIADWCRVDLIDDQGVLKREVAHHADPARAAYGWELVNRLRAAPDTPGSMAWAVRTGRPHLAHFDPPLAYDALRDRDLLTFASAIGMTAYYVVPLVARGRTLGSMAALQAESGRGFSAEDCATIDELGQRAALALDNARLYEEAEAARREAERANRVKDEFLGILGHELRNPLAPIAMALRVMQLKGEAANAEERRIIERQVTHLSRLVDDLLDVSRITQGKIELRREPVDLRGVVVKALELTLPMYERRTRALELDLTEAPCIVAGDEVRLAQVVSNLLINAAKFTPDPGAVRLSLRAADERATIEVADEGVGIDAALLPHVFDLFVQAAQPIDRRTGGLGLGLAIVKMLVRMHGGSVEAASAGEGRGSRFTVRLPLVAAVGEPVAAPSHPQLLPERHGRVLIVDDNRDAADTLALVLEAFGYEVRTAYDSAAALDALRAFAPDAAILDIGLPGMDGYALAGKFAEAPGNARPRLVALTGYGTQQDRDRALRAGFDDHLVKPVDPEHLVAALDRALARGR